MLRHKGCSVCRALSILLPRRTDLEGKFTVYSHLDSISRRLVFRAPVFKAVFFCREDSAPDCKAIDISATCDDAPVFEEVFLPTGEYASYGTIRRHRRNRSWCRCSG
jgi:hypothetical protein